MLVKGIRILDGEGNVLKPTLADILCEIKEKDSFQWSILFVDGVLNPNTGITIQEYEKKINHSENGLSITVEELNQISNRFFQMYETLVLACRDPKLLKRYGNENEMYTTCDIVIDLIDCAFWEVYSKDENIIKRLASKFKEIEFLEPDFEK